MLTQLKSIGLGDKEAKVYLAMLELGPAAVLEIAAKAGVNRPTAYVQIESLKLRGLVSTQTKGKKQLFIAESPEQLVSLIHDEIANAEKKKREIADILPDLQTLFSLSDEKPQVRFFEGIEGFKVMQDDFLKCKSKEIVGFFNADDVDKVFDDKNNGFLDRRVAKKIKARFIYTKSEKKDRLHDDPKTFSKLKYVSPERMAFSSDVTIYDNKVAVAALRGKLVGVIIENQQIADSFRGFFEFAWATIPE